MDHDLALVLGLVIAVFSVPAVISSLSEKRAPRVAAIALIIGCGMCAWALTQKPGGYTLPEIPDTFVRVVARFVN